MFLLVDITTLKIYAAGESPLRLVRSLHYLADNVYNATPMPDYYSDIVNVLIHIPSMYLNWPAINSAIRHETDSVLLVKEI